MATFQSHTRIFEVSTSSCCFVLFVLVFEKMASQKLTLPEPFLVDLATVLRGVAKSHITCETFNVIYLIQCRLCNPQYIGETKRRLTDSFNEHRRPILNPTGNYIHTAVSEHFLTSNHSDNHMLLISIENLKMCMILSGKHVKPALSIKLRHLSLWASINMMNCTYI